MGVTKRTTTIAFDPYHVPLIVRREWRRSVRISLGSTKASLAIPHLLSTGQESRQVEQATSWVQRQIEKRPELGLPFLVKNYTTGWSYNAGSSIYYLELKASTNGKIHCALKENRITIRICESLPDHERSRLIRKNISRLISRNELPAIAKRVHAINREHLGKEIRAVRLRHNYTNWGSCSSNGYINLSSRLLLAPRHIADYVIVHELCHLSFMNHSQQYWNLVESIMPDYLSRRDWLKKNGRLLDF
jgi:predicted metal-dependent hydrolase